MMMRLVIINDSLGMPEPRVSIEKTWTNIILRKFKERMEIYFVQRKGFLSGELRNVTDEIITNIKPNLVVIQLGIVDCSRRALPHTFLRVIEMMPWIQAPVHRFVHKYHYQLSRFFDFRYTKEDAFRNNLFAVVSKFIASGVVPSNLAIILIAPPGARFVSNTYEIAGSVVVYNRIIRALASELGIATLDPFSGIVIEEVLLDDGHHLNPRGHELVVEKVEEFLRQRAG